MGLDGGWFTESEVLWPGQRLSLAVEEVLFAGKSAFQEVLVFRSATYGTVLALDGVVQVTERDEFAYQEMLAHVALCAHPAPRRVLVVGGGDGGVVREIARHACVREIVLCELDPMVCEVSRRFFAGSLASAFGDARVRVVHQDGAQFLDDAAQPFDVVIVDSSDPVGPAESLFQERFFARCRRALCPDRGVLCMQGECIWLHLPLIGQMLAACGRAGFPVLDYCVTSIPTYPSGQIGMVLCCNDPSTRLEEPLRAVGGAAAHALRYYSGESHRGAFMLPVFAEEVVAQWRRRAAPRRLSRAPLLATALAACSLGVLVGLLLARK
jgi:spermidine synthase